MSLYADTSVLLKLFFVEPESIRTSQIVAGEAQIVISSLARLEAIVQVHRRVAAGKIRRQVGVRLLAQIEARLHASPFDLRECPPGLIKVAEEQAATWKAYCPTLDRLHLAAMQLLQLRRLLTNDDTQAAAARALGFEVILPR